AERLAPPSQAPDQVPIPVVVARDSGTLTATDTAAIERLAAGLARVADVQRVKDLGVSRDGRAVQLQVLTSIDVGANGPAGQLAAGLRHTIAASALPGDLHAHLAGDVALPQAVTTALGRPGSAVTPAGRGLAGPVGGFAPVVGRPPRGGVHAGNL